MNFSQEELKTLELRIWSLISFILISIGSYQIHSGLLWIVLGLYIIKLTFNMNGLIHVFITLPPIVDNTESKDELILDMGDEKIYNEIKNLIDEVSKNKKDNEKVNQND